MSQDFFDFDAVFPCPFGAIGLRMRDSKLISVDFIYHAIENEYFISIDVEIVAREIQSYFQNPQQKFTMNLDLQGTVFQQKVWQQLQLIPSGQTKTYGEIAEILCSSARAVGNACRRNPVPLVVPCHRVVAKNGVGGFAGATTGEKIKAKHWLLDFEANS